MNKILKTCTRIPVPIRLFVLSFVMYVISVLPIIIIHKGLFFYYGDFNVQQVPFYVLAHRAVRQGRFLWNWHLDLGGTLVGGMSFYLLGSPFFWLTIPFPEQIVPFLMPYLMALKYATCAATSYLYIRHYTKTETAARTGALLFAFSGFNACNIVFNHFTDVVAFFPLLMLAFDRLCELDTGEEPAHISQGFDRWISFALMSCLIAVINYYFFFGMVMFLALYAIIRYVMRYEARAWFSMLVRAMTGGVAGVLLAGAYLMLALTGVAGNTRLDNVLLGYDLLAYPSALMYFDILKSMIMVPDIIGRGTLFYTTTVKNSSLAVYLPLFGIAGVAAYLHERRYRRTWKKTLLLLCFVMAMVPGLNAAFSLLNVQYYCRWYYMPILFMAIVTAVMMDTGKLGSLRAGALTECGMFALLLLVYCLPSRTEEGEIVWLRISDNRTFFLADAAVTAVLLVMLLAAVFILDNRRLRNTFLYYGTMIGAVGMTMVVTLNGKSLISNYGMDMWRLQMLETEPTLPPDDTVYYRIEGDNTTTNYEMVWGKSTLHCFLSTVPGAVFDFYAGTADVHRTVESNVPMNREGLRAILSARYYIWNSDINTDGEFGKGEGVYGFRQVSEENGFTIYENDNWIPFGFAYKHYIRESVWNDVDKDVADRMLVHAVIIPDDCADKVSGVMEQLPSGMVNTYFSDAEFEENCALRRETACTSFRTKDEDGRMMNGFEAVTADLPEESFLFFSVPNAPDFEVTVNGEAAEIIPADYGMMGVLVPAGISEIKAVYRPRGMAAGCVISLAGALFILAYGAYCAACKNRDEKKETVDSSGVYH